MWFGMMTSMMVPTVWPWVAAFNRLGRQPTAIFSSGYAAAWLLYSLAAASIQLLLPHQLPNALAASILFIAGAFQFAPIKRACLMHCRNPLTYFLTRWRDGALGRLPHGLRPRPLLRRLLLGADGDDARGRRDEPVVDGRAGGGDLRRAGVAVGRSRASSRRRRA